MMRRHWWAGNSGQRTDEVCRRRQILLQPTMTHKCSHSFGIALTLARDKQQQSTDNNNMNINHFSDKSRPSRKQCMQRVFVHR